MKRLSLILLFAAVIQASQTQSGAIRGDVVTAGSEGPAVGATVRVDGGRDSWTVVTGARGEFLIENVRPGRYTVAVRMSGYVDLAHDSSVEVDSVRGAAPAFLRLTVAEARSISGMVFDTRQQPAAGVPVAALRQVYRNGRPALETAGVARTNANGEYSIVGIGPGLYHVRAEPEGLLPTYYPSTTNPAVAPQVSTRERDFVGVHIGLQPTSGATVSGMVADAVSGGPFLRISSIALVPRDAAASQAASQATYRNWSDPRRQTRGEFEIRGVPPGAYDMYALALKTAGVYLATPVPIEVNGSDVIKDMVIHVHPGVEVRGRLALEQGASARMNRIGVDLRLATHPEEEFISTVIAPLSRLGSDGTFVFANVPRGKYRLNLTGELGAAYLADVLIEDVSVFDNGFDVSDSPPAELRAVLRKTTAAIEGTAIRSDGAPSSFADVVLVPASERRGNPALFRNVRANGAGSFTFEHLPPGRYSVFSWKGAPPGAQFNPSFIAATNERGRQIVVEENARMDVGPVLTAIFE